MFSSQVCFRFRVVLSVLGGILPGGKVMSSSTTAFLENSPPSGKAIIGLYFGVR